MARANRLALGIVAYGRDNARAGSEPRVIAEVEKEFAERLKRASPAELLVIKVQMEAEIKRRLKRIAPPWALY